MRFNLRGGVLVTRDKRKLVDNTNNSAPIRCSVVILYDVK